MDPGIITPEFYEATSRQLAVAAAVGTVQRDGATFANITANGGPPADPHAQTDYWRFGDPLDGSKPLVPFVE